MHAFTGDADLAAQCLELGLYISFAGMVTFKKSAGLREVAAAVPDDRILIETDAPYLSPHPHRARRRNEPALLVHTAACVAEVRGVDVNHFARQTEANARRLFRLNRQTEDARR
jgi:TatD DNase family protein